MSKLVIGLSAILALVPVAALPFRVAPAERAAMFWSLLAIAVLGPLVYVATQLAGQWHSGLSATLWVSVAASSALFAVLCLLDADARRLTPLLMGYLVVLSAIAMVWAHAPEHLRVARTIDGWLLVHIVLSVLAYALATIAAVAGAAVFVKERALKRKRPGRLSGLLPAVADADRLQVRLLTAAEAVLGVDIVSGMAVEYMSSGALLRFEHKQLLSLLAFAVILGLLILHGRTGVRGRTVARSLLVAYLLLTLGYPGVKFVTDVLMA